MNHIDRDPLPGWSDDLRRALTADLRPDRAREIGLLAGAVASSTLATAAAAATGGTTMNAMIAATAASQTSMKIAAGSLAAVLTAGAAAVATGSVTIEPDLAEQATVQLTERVGITVDGSLDAPVEGDVTVETFGIAGLGVVHASFDGSVLDIVDVEADAGVRATVLSQSTDSATIEFAGDGEILTALIATVDGEIVASITSEAAVGGSVTGERGAETSDDGERVDVGAGVDSEVSADVEDRLRADVGATLEGDVGIGLDD